MAGGEGWNIDPEAVKAVCDETLEAGENLSESLGSFQDPIVSAVEGAGGSRTVAEALYAFSENRQRSNQEMVNRVQAGVAGAATATGWYVQGDEEMAAQQQANISGAVSTGDLSGFEAYT